MPKAVSRQMPRLYLVYGDDAFRVAAEAEALVAKLVPPAERAVCLDVLDGRADNAASALTVLYRCREALLTPGFMGGHKTIWLREARCLGGQLARLKDVASAIEALAQTIAAGLDKDMALVVSASAVDAKSPLLAAVKDAQGHISMHAAVKPWEQEKAARSFLKQAFVEKGLTVSADALDAFLNAVGCDLRVYAQEIEKLALFVFPRTKVASQDVIAVSSALRESDGLDFLDAVANRDFAAALAHYRRLILQKTAPMQMVSGLYSSFRTLALLAELMRLGVLSIERRNAVWHDPDGSMMRTLDDAFGAGEAGKKSNPMRMNSYRIGILAGQARLFASHELTDALRRITEAREELVRSNRPESLVMELLLLRICRRPRR